MNIIFGMFIILNLFLAVGWLLGSLAFKMGEKDTLKWYHFIIGFQLLVGSTLGIVALIVLWFGE